MNENTKFAMVEMSDNNFYDVHLLAISINNEFTEIANWTGLHQFVKTLDLCKLPTITYHHECPYDDGVCHECLYCYDKADDEEYVCIPIYSYGLNWKQNRKLVSAFCAAWADYDIFHTLNFILFHRKSLNKTCGRRWVDRLLRKFRHEYFSAF